MRRKPTLLLMLIVAVASLSLMAADEARAETHLGAIGGGGGSRFTHPCPAGQNLTGFELRVGDWVDAMRPVCVISDGPVQTSAGAVLTEWHGGSGGGPNQLLCPPSTPIVLGLRVWIEGRDTVSVHGIQLFCGLASTAQSIPSEPSAIFEGRPVPGSRAGVLGGLMDAFDPDATFAASGRVAQYCPSGQVAVGVDGRSGIWLDAIGLICDAPRLAAVLPTVKAQGRVRLDTDASAPAGPTRSICDLARQARARNSPAAPGLEAKCAEVGEPTVKAQGRVRLDNGASTPTAQTRSICDLARQARARNSPAAPGLEAKCKEVGEALPVKTAKVILGVDVFDAPGGGGNRIGALNAETIVGFVVCQPDNWCHVNGNNVPGGDGWIYSGPDYRSLQV